MTRLFLKKLGLFTKLCPVAVLSLVVWVIPSVVCAQDVPPESDRTVKILPRSAFHMSAAGLSYDDPKFSWDANFGGELDLVDYGVGRLTFEANYQVLLGKEFRTFDPNQGNYILASQLSLRINKTEVAAVLYHQSRHLSDRPKRKSIDWNELGIRVRRQFVSSRATLDTRADLRAVITKSAVDYSWELDTGLRLDVPLRPGVGAMANFDYRHLGVDGRLGRSGQTGLRLDGGIRLEGRAAAVELFVGVERRIDPFPFEFGTAQWFSAGFRLLSR
ncbi:MAG: hypothetical protein HQ485_05305 [Acidobacteria bacterium]|nr:hypothetical protein [Acidobacteriota bacterium]